MRGEGRGEERRREEKNGVQDREENKWIIAQKARSTRLYLTHSACWVLGRRRWLRPLFNG